MTSTDAVVLDGAATPPPPSIDPLARSARRAGAAVSLVVLLGITLGCSSTDPLTSAEVALYDSDGSTNDAASTGTLDRQNGCIYLRSGRFLTLPFFPRGDVRWDGTLLTYDGRSYRLGDEILVGGSESQPRPGASVPASCDQDVPVWVVAPAWP